MRGTWLDSGPVGLSHEYHNNGSIMELSNNKPSPLQYRELRVDGEKQADCDEDVFERQRSPATESEQARAGGVGGESPLLMSQQSSARVGTATGAVTSSVLSCAPTDTIASQVPDQLTAIMEHSAPEQCSRSSVRPRLSVTCDKNNDDVEGWQQVSRRKQTKKYRFMGKAGVARDVEYSFKAADRKIPMFITNVFD
ncbi:hypothetical protein PYW08_006988 [Mythimna loreyi]|uniref:Uncharacterized protein n=1 Tax=Mythimna loreyi TaxID=667449 RepID=A0ACC2R8L3_9NEOP|nr:hypothetical protein PYW08_006988 [Mythimna loreyi]